MSNDTLHELYRQHRTAEDKYTYFLLAAVGAAIGFTVTQTQDIPLEWRHTPAGVAVICWGLSFFYGCRHLAYVSSTLFANYDLVKIQTGQHEEFSGNPRIRDVAVEGISKAIQHNSDRARRLAKRQFVFLIAGGVAFLLWHVIRIAL